MDTRTSPCREPQRPALPKRFDRRRMGYCRADDPASATRRTQTVGECARGFEWVFSTCCGPGASGRRCRKTCRRRARCTTISNFGTGTARWNASITRCTWRCVNRRDVKQVRRQRSSTPRPQRVPKKGGLARSFGLRRGQEDQRSQAAHPGRHAGPPVERHCSPCGYSGPRRGLPAAAPCETIVPVHQAHLC